MTQKSFNQAVLDRVGKAKDQINDAILTGEPISVAHIAHNLGCTAGTFRTEFKSVTGIEVTVYINQQRSNPELPSLLGMHPN